MTRVLDAEVAVPAQCQLGEGPVWDPARGLLWWVDILAGHVHSTDPSTGGRTRFDVGDAVGAVGLIRSGGLVLALADGFALASTDGQELARVPGFSIDRTALRFNDGKPDPWGNFIAGTMAWDESGVPPGSLYRLSPDGAVTELFGDVGLSNGLDWTDDRKLFYYSDTNLGRVDVFDTDPDTGALSGRRPFVTAAGPDGLTLDAEGCLWLALWGSGELRRYTPGGRLDTVVRLPAWQVTSAAFGGPDLGTLYITSAAEGLTPAEQAEQPHAGDIFACIPGVTGRPPFLFAGLSRSTIACCGLPHCPVAAGRVAGPVSAGGRSRDSRPAPSADPDQDRR
jgi:sugar lactone lactonase YvrE